MPRIPEKGSLKDSKIDIARIRQEDRKLEEEREQRLMAMLERSRLTFSNPKEEMEKLWKKIDKKIEKYGELSDEDIQKEIQKVRARRRKSKARP